MPVLALVSLAVGAGGCAGISAEGRYAEDLVARSLVDLFHREFDTAVRYAPTQSVQVEALRDVGVAVWVGRDEIAAPWRPLSEAAGRALRDYVEGGGRLLLLGSAVRLVHELGIEPAAPEVRKVHWGADERTALGLLQLGVTLVANPGDTNPGGAARVVADLRAFPGEPRSFLVAGGQGVETWVSGWTERAPAENAVVLGRACAFRDERFEREGTARWLEWRVGSGQIVAFGIVPEPWRAEPAVAANARRVVCSLARELLRGAQSRKVALLLGEPAIAKPVASVEARSFAERGFPGAVSVPHWGVQASVAAAAGTAAMGTDGPAGVGGAATVSPRAIYDRVLVPSFHAGATLVDLRLAETGSGYPFSWSEDDAVARPASWRSGDALRSAGWDAEQVGLLAREAHHRGMWLQLDLDPAPMGPVGGYAFGAPLDPELLDATAWLARSLVDLRLLGRRAIDGLDVGRWAADPRGVTASMTRTFHPGLHGLQWNTRRFPVAGFATVAHAARGGVPGVRVSGLSAQWRGGSFLAEDYPVGLLDARLGRGNYPDWLVTQVGDFARPRLGRGAVILWQMDATGGERGERTVDAERYVFGLSVDPMRAAVTGRLSATGRDGYRAICARMSGRTQRGFGAESPLPAATPFLQNNWLRLHGSGGPVWFDPTGTADFRVRIGGVSRPGADDPVGVGSNSGDALRELSPRWIRTRVRGFRPRVQREPPVEIDWVGGSPRGEGGYGAVATVRAAEPTGVGFPARLAVAAVPAWPGRVAIECELGAGTYELAVRLRRIVGQGVLEVRGDGEVQALLPFGDLAVDDEQQAHQVTLPFATDGEHRIEIELLAMSDGDAAVGLEGCKLTRVEVSAAASRVVQAAGHVAEVAETSTSSYLHEEVRLRMLADLPAVLVTGTCRRAVDHVQVVRSFALPHHTRVRTGGGSSTDAMVEPFVLESDDARLPDLAFVPTLTPFGFRFTLESGQLELVTYPRPNQDFAFCMFALDRSHASVSPSELLAVAKSLRAPPVLRLEPGTSRATVELAPLVTGFEVADWPRLVQVSHPQRTPFVVRERGFWSVRGGRQQVAVASVGAAESVDPTGGQGAQWLRVYPAPGQPVEVATWDRASMAAWPGPGSQASIAWRQAHASAAGSGEVEFEVEVLQVGALESAPSIEFRAAFDRVELGRVGEDLTDWRYFDDGRVWLPLAAGRYRIRLRNLDRPAAPRLARTRAVVTRCQWDATSSVLEITTRARPEDSADTTYTAWIAGPEPIEVQGAVAIRVDDSKFRYSAEQRARAIGNGTIVRFRPGSLRIRFP